MWVHSVRERRPLAFNVAANSLRRRRVRSGRKVGRPAPPVSAATWTGRAGSRTNLRTDRALMQCAVRLDDQACARDCETRVSYRGMAYHAGWRGLLCWALSWAKVPSVGLTARRRGRLVHGKTRQKRGRRWPSGGGGSADGRADGPGPSPNTEGHAPHPHPTRPSVRERASTKSCRRCGYCTGAKRRGNRTRPAARTTPTAPEQRERESATPLLAASPRGDGQRICIPARVV